MPAPVTRQKATGAFYTPDDVVRSLVNWAVRRGQDRLLDPSCGDGRFLRVHPNSVGVEQDQDAAEIVHRHAPGSLIHQGEFFEWAGQTCERFDCAAGNPPFIRYQRFTGATREAAFRLCSRHGAAFSSLSSSWAPFLVATATLLKPGGRMAFVVPAEIGHAPYARPVLEYFATHFAQVQIVAVRRKLFPDLSEDCWLLYADGFGGRAGGLTLSVLDSFRFMAHPPKGERVSLAECERWGGRLRPFILPATVRSLYEAVAASEDSVRFGGIARVGIGYVTGANDFFHLRPSEALSNGIPESFLRPAIRNGRALTGQAVTPATVRRWRKQDEPMLLLDLGSAEDVPRSVRRYLDSPAGHEARTSFKCRTRDPWYVVPDVTVPDGFLSYMSGTGPTLVENKARCVGTNSVHVVRLQGALSMESVQRIWSEPFTHLSCELEGHPLGGGMLKLEPREAGRVVLHRKRISSASDQALIAEGLRTIRRWRHSGKATGEQSV